MADRDGSSDERDDEPFVVSGQLKLKGGLKLTRKKKKKSKKKSKKHKKDKDESDDAKRNRDDDESNNDVGEAGGGSSFDGEGGAKRARTEGDEEGVLDEDSDDGLTPAQRAFEKVRQEREDQTLEKLVSKSYRERVEEFNDYLGSLSEHHAVANVGNAGMG